MSKDIPKALDRDDSIDDDRDAPTSDTDRRTEAYQLAKVVLVEEWEIEVAANGWGIIRCPDCKQILRPLEPMPPCIDGYTTHYLRNKS